MEKLKILENSKPLIQMMTKKAKKKITLNLQHEKFLVTCWIVSCNEVKKQIEKGKWEILEEKSGSIIAENNKSQVQEINPMKSEHNKVMPK